MRNADARWKRAAEPRRWQVVTALAGALALAGACGSSSNAEVKPDGGAGTTGAGGAAAGTTGTGGGVECAARATFTEASHLTVNVSWSPGIASMGGTGQIHVWGKTAFTSDGNALSGTLQACGIVLPATTLTAIGGGGMILIEVPDATWDAPTMPRFPVSGTQSGWNVGTTISYGYTALIGTAMADLATAAWPSSYTGITMITDADGDLNPGLTSLPRSGGSYTLPPTSILQAARVDKIFIVIRNASSPMLTRTACDEASGPATFMHIDNHVVGCHVMGASDCMPSEVNFVDSNRAIYTVTGATARTKIVADTATCADVRAALPL
jgi:hypothetical protein